MTKSTVAGWVAAVAALLLVAPVVLLLTAPMMFHEVLERGVKGATGFELALAGLEVDAFPPRLVTRDMRLTNPESDFGKPLLTVRKAEVTANAFRWWDGASSWWSADVQDVLVYFGESEEGVDIWQTPAIAEAGDNPAAKPAPGAASDTAVLEFEILRLTDVQVKRVSGDGTFQPELSKVLLEKYTDERIEIMLDGALEGESLQASGTLALPSSDRAQVVDFQAQMPGGEITVNGTVGHDGVVPGEANFSADIDDLSALSRLLGEDYSYLQPVSMAGVLRASQVGRWELTLDGHVAGEAVDLAGSVNTEGAGLELREVEASLGESGLRGSGFVNAGDKRLELELNSELIDVDTLARVAGERAASPQAQPAAGNPLAAFANWQADVTANAGAIRFRQYRVSGLSAALRTSGEGTLDIEGTVERLAAGNEGVEDGEEQAPGASAEGRARGDVAAGSGESAQTAWDISQPLKFALQLPMREGAQGGNALTVQITARDLTLHAESEMPTDGVLPDRATVSLEVENLAAISAGGLDKSRWDTFLPVSISFAARSEPASLYIDSLEVQLADDVLNGNLVIKTGGDIPHVSGELQTPLIDINRFRTSPVEAISGDQGDAADRETADIIPDTPLDWSWLDAVGLDLELLISELIFNQTRLRNARLHVVQDASGLVVDPLRADMAVGGIRGSLQIDKSEDVPTIDSRLIVTQLTPADLGRKNAGLIDGGATDILLNFNTRGMSPQDLADHLNGELALEIQRADIRNNLFEIVGSDLLVETVSLINPFAKRDDTTELECAAAYFRAKEGVLVSPDQLVVETGKMKIRGGGEIDLRDESLRIDFIPRARAGLGVSLGGLASVVRIGGSLANPRPEADPVGLLTAGASIGAAISTGGLSLLAEGLFDRALAAGGTACGKIFEKVPEADIPGALEVEESSPVSDARSGAGFSGGPVAG